MEILIRCGRTWRVLARGMRLQLYLWGEEADDYIGLIEIALDTGNEGRPADSALPTPACELIGLG